MQLLDAADPLSIELAAAALRAGHLVAFPTETVYGLGADATQPAAVSRIFQTKGRPTAHPLIVHVANVAVARRLALDWPAAAQSLAEAFWPGPLTLIVQAAAGVLRAVTGGQATVGLRVPAHPQALALLEAFELIGSGAVAAPSANPFGGLSPTHWQHVRDVLGARLSQTDLILCGVPSAVGLESTIVDCTHDEPRILRPGGLSRAEIARVVPLQGVGAPRASNAPRVSGQQAMHYAPRTPLRLVSAESLGAHLANWAQGHPGQRAVVWAVTASEPANLEPAIDWAMAPSDAAAYGAALYAQLHDWDAQGCYGLMVLELPPPGPAWEAIEDRLVRAAHQA